MTTVWQDQPPPPAQSGRPGKYDWPDIVRRLKAKPGQWLLIDNEANTSLQSAIRRRKMTALQDENWTFSVRCRNTNREARTTEVWMSADKREDT